MRSRCYSKRCSKRCRAYGVCVQRVGVCRRLRCLTSMRVSALVTVGNQGLCPDGGCFNVDHCAWRSEKVGGKVAVVTIHNLEGVVGCWRFNLSYWARLNFRRSQIMVDCHCRPLSGQTLRSTYHLLSRDSRCRGGLNRRANPVLTVLTVLTDSSRGLRPIL